jgi:hypothetical protein
VIRFVLHYLDSVIAGHSTRWSDWDLVGSVYIYVKVLIGITRPKLKEMRSFNI